MATNSVTMKDANENTSAPPAVYATFTLRARALVIDSAVLAGCLVLLVIASAFIENVPGSGRLLLAGIFGLVFLYEPILVSRNGATIGHRRVNIRVVSLGSDRPPVFVVAFARFVIKAFLGLPSFFTMAFTRRHQAIHDVLTRTTVQVRDHSIASLDDFVEERPSSDADLAAMPPWWRRVAVIAVYAG